MPQNSDKEVLEMLSQSKLSDEEVVEARNNLLGFFETLYRIDKRLREEKHDR